MERMDIPFMLRAVMLYWKFMTESKMEGRGPWKQEKRVLKKEPVRACQFHPGDEIPEVEIRKMRLPSARPYKPKNRWWNCV